MQDIIKYAVKKWELDHLEVIELDTDHEGTNRQHIEEVIRLLGEQSGYPTADIVKLFYMETVLANVWCVEDGEEMNLEEMELADYLIGHDSILKCF